MPRKNEPLRLTAAEFREQAAKLPAKTRHKFGAIAEKVDGHHFPSRLEARRYHQLSLMERAGAISGLLLQPTFMFEVNGVRVGEYRGDFSYQLPRSEKLIVEDTKGVSTPVYKLKLKLMQALYPQIEIREIKK